MSTAFDRFLSHFFSSASGFQPPDAPPIGGLVLHARIKGDLVIGGRGQAGGVVDGHLGHTDDGIGPGAQGGGEGDGIAGVQLMNVAKIAVCSSIVVE